MNPRSAAVQIVRPPTGSSEGAASAAASTSNAAAPVFVPAGQQGGNVGQAGAGSGSGKKDATQRLCRNVLIYGVCKFQDSGCVYYHPSSGEVVQDGGSTPTQADTATSVATSTNTNTNALKTPSTLSANLAAPVFIPKTPMAGNASPRAASPMIQPAGTPSVEWPVSNTTSGLMGPGESSTPMPMAYEDPSAYDHSMHYLPPRPQYQLDHHLYTPSLPFLTNPPITKHPLHSFFIPDDLRHMIQARHDATYLGNVPAGTGLPSEVGPYHSLLPLDHRMGISKTYGYQAPVYRAISSVDGGVYCLRRVEGYKVSSQDAFSAMEKWRQMRHPNIVSLREAFTTKAFNDNSLMMVYDFHPNSANLDEEHLNHELMAMTPRRKSSPPIPERLLWSYITQLANALKAIHSSGMALRGLDPSRILLTGKNRIRISGAGILDILSYDPHAHVSALQHDDLVSLGKLIMSLCCEWFVPGQHPAAPLDHISRHYSPDVKNLVMYLCGKPPSGKSIDEVVSILGLRILNEFDAMQNYNDMLESELGSEVENGRLVRLMTKMGFINERAEFELDPRWSDTGDRYIIKLFRDFVFHSTGVDGQPVLDLSHVLTSLNKLDAGLDERVMLVSRDDQSCLVVSYREIKSCIEAAYNELRGPKLGLRR